MDTTNLQLFSQQGFVANVADLVIGDLLDEDGYKYQPVKVTIPFTTAVRHGTSYAVFDIKSQEKLVQFVVMSVKMILRGEQFNLIEGHKIITFKP